MFANWQLIAVSLSYIGLLFGIAYLGDKYRHHLTKQWQPLIYAMTMGVYCTSWSFMGTTGQAATDFFSHLPIFLGPILLFVFAWPFLMRMIRVSIKLNLTSIADLLAARFGKSHNLAILVTIVALVGTMPYLALQLKAIVYSFEQLQGRALVSSAQLGLIISMVLAGFTIVFGVRQLDVTERHPGVMLAIAFESLVKLFAFVTIGIFVCFFLFDSPLALWEQAGAQAQVEEQLAFSNITGWLAMLIIVMAAFLSLPRQFQVMVVELQDERDTRLARSLFPIYLFIFAVLAIPMGLAGKELLGNQVPADTYVLFLPAASGQAWMTLLAFLGAISAASSMVIIAAIALSTMLSNEIIFPLVYRYRSRKQQLSFDEFRVNLLKIRKFLVFFVIMLGYLVFLVASPDALAALGVVAFGAFAQLTPALLAAFYWRGASLTGVFAGILVGFSMWLFLSFLPQLGISVDGFSDALVNSSTMVSLFSLVANIFVMYTVSQISRQSVQERVQASVFLEWQPTVTATKQHKKAVSPKELELLVSRFIGQDKARESFASFDASVNKVVIGAAQYNQQLLHFTESKLASTMGASSARLVLSSALEGRDFALDELAILVEEASSQQQQFGQSLLQSAIENASEGISIIDKSLNLVAWNKKYLELFGYPESLVYVGSPIASLIRFNLERDLYAAKNIEQQVQRRIDFLRQGSPHSSERELGDKVIRIQGNPLPDGGFVMLFSDISAYRRAEQVLKDANVDLEARVNERTEKLANANRELARAREKAEQAHYQKSLYLKACSHDLMQPIEAARLFSEALANQSLSAQQQRQVDNISNSLKVANELLSDLAEITRIESGKISPNVEPFALQTLFDEIASEFSLSAQQHGVEFQVMPTKVWVYSDGYLLRRMLQNLITNAFRYASPGRLLLGVRRSHNKVLIQVIDTGPGIPAAQQTAVFEQFTQLAQEQHSGKGLGLGLSITKGISQVLGHQLSLVALQGHGCCFSIAVPRVEAVSKPIMQANKPATLNGICVLCVDDDEDVLAGMVEMLSSWHCEVLAANSAASALTMFAQHKLSIDILLVDYQLSATDNGIELIQAMRAMTNVYLPAILVSASSEYALDDKAAANEIGFMRKMVKPAALRALMSAKLSEQLHRQFIAERG
ncbi:response regulator [Thalassotalea euphylliae]|uniref:histidine kinase n=1 Tax=Thalassotalea euphylliae TaxID=1655234 RepID=A0A3E0TLV2_9GAMM|nr:PAS domain-containing hybrid sensor histidine kinase/response regulator [Thalassotalea euphylliae]REL25162.1 response regulator [Thalassotalea euphylliae]